MIKIGHASIDENGSVAGGKSGDQTGREVCIRTWYKKNWLYILRARDPQVAEAMARACEAACLNPNIGYSQPRRNTLYTELIKNGFDISSVAPCEADCSSFMTACAICGGVKELKYAGNAPTTRTMQAAFTKTGKFDILFDPKYLTSDTYLKRGDILVAPGAHTVMALENGQKPTATKPRNLKLGSSGSDVKELQKRLNELDHYGLEVDGIFGNLTRAAVLHFQQVNNLVSDGIVGPKTRAVLYT